jgi:hypothetical protein
MQREFIRFIEQPSADTYLSARDAMLKQEPETLTASALLELVRLSYTGNHEALLAHTEQLPASAALSPRVHFYAAEAAAAAGDAERAELERFLFVVCLQGILATGDGSAERPYVICHQSDETDVLEALDKRSERRTLAQLEHAVYDVVDCEDESRIHFDVSVITGTPVRRRRVQTRRVAKSRVRPAVSRTPR